MNEKKYDLPNGKTAVFCYDDNGVGRVTLEAMDALMEMLRCQWIPVSERLPSDEDYDETFAVTIQCEHHDGWEDYVTGYADWTPHGWDIQSYYIGQIKVVAWMPLPKPYKEKNDE